MLQPTVLPKVLRDLMDEKGLTSAALAEQSGVAAKTVSRLLNPPQGRGKRPRLQTIKTISDALGTTPGILCGNVVKNSQQKRTLADEAYEADWLKTQINVRVDHGTRNAMSLICRRYGVKPYQVVMLAPLLFHCLAELSLKRRLNRLNEIETKQAEVEAMRDNFRHLHACLWVNATGGEIFFAEKESIVKGNIFADDILDIESFTGPASDEFYEDENSVNPFSNFISDFVSDACENARFDGFDRSSSGACYTFDESLALDYVKGNKSIAHAIVNGVVGIHEIPTDLRDQNDRLNWLEKTIEDRRLESERFFSEMNGFLNEEDVTDNHQEKKYE